MILLWVLDESIRRAKNDLPEEVNERCNLLSKMPRTDYFLRAIDKEVLYIPKELYNSLRAFAAERVCMDVDYFGF